MGASREAISQPTGHALLTPRCRLGCEHRLGLGPEQLQGKLEAPAGTTLSYSPEPGSPCHGSSHGSGLGLAVTTVPARSLARSWCPQHPPLGCSGAPRMLAPLTVVPRACSAGLLWDPGTPSPKAGAGSSTLYPHCWRPFPTRKSQSHWSSLSGD